MGRADEAAENADAGAAARCGCLLRLRPRDGLGRVEVMANKNGGDMAINPLGAVEGDGEGAGGDGEEEDAVDVIERRRRCGDANSFSKKDIFIILTERGVAPGRLVLYMSVPGYCNCTEYRVYSTV